MCCTCMHMFLSMCLCVCIFNLCVCILFLKLYCWCVPAVRPDGGMRVCYQQVQSSHTPGPHPVLVKKGSIDRFLHLYNRAIDRFMHW